MIWRRGKPLNLAEYIFGYIARDVVVKLTELFRFTLHPKLTNILLNEIYTLLYKFIISFLVVVQ